MCVFFAKEPPLWLWHNPKKDFEGWVVTGAVGKCSDDTIVAWAPPAKEGDTLPWPTRIHIPYWQRLHNSMVRFFCL